MSDSQKNYVDPPLNFQKTLSVWGTACFLFNTIVIILVSVILIYSGFVHKKYPTSGCSTETSGIVESVSPNPSNTSDFSVTVRYSTIEHPNEPLYGTLISSQFFPVGSKVRLYYSPDNPQLICWYKSKWSYLVGAGFALLGLHLFVAVALYFSETFRAFYGAVCALKVLR